MMMILIIFQHSSESDVNCCLVIMRAAMSSTMCVLAHMMSCKQAEELPTQPSLIPFWYCGGVSHWTNSKNMREIYN